MAAIAVKIKTKPHDPLVHEAMIRGRAIRHNTTNNIPITNDSDDSKPKPLACLKEQRRILLAYLKSSDKALTPIDDPDPFYANKNTFVVFNKNRVIYRFSQEKALYLFGRESAVRQFFIKVLVNKWFNALVIATILINCLLMIVVGNENYTWSEKYVEHIFTSIYTVEAVVKIVGRGFILHRFSYLRDAWNWLDFIVIIAAFVLIFLNNILESSQISNFSSGFTFLRAIRVLRVFKTVSVIPGLRTIVSALIASTKALKDAMLLSLLGFSMFSLVGIQIFRGTLQQKCVLNPPWLDNYGFNCSLESLETSKNLSDCWYNHSFSEFIEHNFGRVTYGEVQFLFYNSTLYEHLSLQNLSSSYDYFGSGNRSFLFDQSDDEDFSFNVAATALPQRLEYARWTFQVASNQTFNSTNYRFDYETWINDEKHFYHNDYGALQLCGNKSSALQCPNYTSCIQTGTDPNFGFTSFNTFYYAFLCVFRLALQDNWEELYLQVLETNGLIAWFFFLAMIFLGSYYLINLILAVVASSYEDQRKTVANSLEEEKVQMLREKEFLKRRNADVSTIDYDQLNIQQKKLSFSQCCPRFEAFKSICLISTAEMLTVGLVILNTLVMALEHEPKTDSFDEFLDIANNVFTALFTVEMVSKMFAFAPYKYFKETWNIFDFVVVSLSLLEIILSGKLPDGLSVLRVFRLIRLVRILKLARSWPTLSKLMKMIGDSLSKVGYLTLVLLIVLIISALAGMQTLGNSYHIDYQTGLPLRWHMHDFVHAFLVVFRIQCGEWIQNMWNCMDTVRQGESIALVPVCVVIFIGVVFVGNLVVLNLFLALLLNSFSSDALNSKGGKKSRGKKIMKSLRNAGKKAIPRLPNGVKRSRKVVPLQGKKYSTATENEIKAENGNLTSIPTTNGVQSNGYHKPMSTLSEETSSQSSVNNDKRSTSSTEKCAKAANNINNNTIMSSTNGLQSNGYHMPTSALPEETSSRSSENNEDKCSTSSTENCAKENSTISNNNTNSTSSITNDCFVSVFDKSDSSSSNADKNTSSDSRELENPTFTDRWKRFRQFMNTVVQHNIFETFIIFMITLSSVALVFEDIHLDQKKNLKEVLMVFDRIFTAVFVAEMLMKWLGFGLKKYFTNGWCLLDFGIVVVSLVSLLLDLVTSGNLSFLRVLRSLRAFRPLRAMSRFHGIKVVTDALFRSIPSIINVFVICMIFWLVFAIMGVNLFAGKMASCQWVETGEKIWHPQDFIKYPELLNHYNPTPINVTNREECEHLANSTGGKVAWKNLLVNFDNVANAYVSLLQVATFKGWLPIMYAAVDSPSKMNDQPIRDNGVEYYFFFVTFIIFGAFFTLNLFISVVIDNFNQQKKKFELTGGELFISESQKKAFNALKKLKKKFPKHLLPIPKSRWRERLYMIVTSDKFELTVLVVTLLNLVVMAIEHEGMSEDIEQALENINYSFVIIFTLEIFLRVLAMGKSYFYIPWNVFDFLLFATSFVVTGVSIVLRAMSEVGEEVTTISTSPWLPTLRLIRVVRILRVARVASGIRTLLFALVLSLPALFNVGSLLFLFMFIYAIFGMSQFGRVEKNAVLNDILNFETFPNTFLLLFQVSTSAGWDGFMEPTLYTDENNSPCSKDKDSCVSTSFIGYFYFVSYLLITFVIVTNMYIAIILENFELATKDNEEALTADDFEHFFDVWQRFDKNGNGRLSVEQLSDMLAIVDRPLRIEKPNNDTIAEMRIPLCENYELHIVDVAAALIKRVLDLDRIPSKMEEDLQNYFQTYSSDNGVRVSDTKLYSEMNWSAPGKELIDYLAKQLRDSAAGLRVSLLGSVNVPNFPTEEKEAEESLSKEPNVEELKATTVEVHRTWEPEVVLPFSKEVCKTAAVVRTSSPAYVKSSLQTPLCDVIDRSGYDEVIITNELQRFSKNTNQNRNPTNYKLTQQISIDNSHTCVVSFPNNYTHRVKTKGNVTEVTFMSRMRVRYAQLPLISTLSKAFLRNETQDASLSQSHSQYPLLNRHLNRSPAETS